MDNVAYSRIFNYGDNRFVRVYLSDYEEFDAEYEYTRAEVSAYIVTSCGITCGQIPLIISRHSDRTEAVEEFKRLSDFYSVNGDPEHKRAGNIIKGLRKAGYDARALLNSEGRIYKVAVLCGDWKREEYYMNSYTGDVDEMVKAILRDLKYWGREPILKAKRKETRK